MNTSPPSAETKPLSGLLLSLLALILSAATGAAADGPAAVNGSSLVVKATTPASPAKLETGQRLNIAIHYKNAHPGSVRIWARPYTNGQRTGGYWAHPSSSYATGEGDTDGWFGFDQAATVDEIRVEMVGGDRQIVASASLPVNASWVGEPKQREKPSAPQTPSVSAPKKGVPPTGIREGDVPEIKFTSTNGRVVDLQAMRGKVVLIDFWATWCGPCMAELPHVLEAYRKLHGEGFEIVGISFDQDKAKLAQVTKEKGMIWPQYFDGTGWKNQFGVKYGIHGIPTMWLINKQGKIATTNARDDLAGKVEKLLAE